MESKSKDDALIELCLKSLHRLARQDGGNSLQVSQLWKLTIKAAHKFNSHPSIASLEQYWIRMKGRRSDDARVFGQGDNPLDIFGDYVSQGEYPPPEILASVGWMINSYRLEHGEKSLDQVFTGQKHSKKNRSHAYKSHKNLYFSVFAEMLVKRPEDTQTAVAEDFITEHGCLAKEIDALDFLREYRRWRQTKPVRG